MDPDLNRPSINVVFAIMPLPANIFAFLQNKSNINILNINEIRDGIESA
jgi:hypothetical protein